MTADQLNKRESFALKKIVSGGQTGADRAALDFAIENDIPHGGWCPKGRKAEDGPLEVRYLLTETPSSSFPQRTGWNVRDSDGSIIFSIAPILTGGSKKTIDFAIKHERPWLHLHQGGASPDIALLEFIREHAIATLNVAGPRASKEPEVGGFVKSVLEAAFLQAASVMMDQRSIDDICREQSVWLSGLELWLMRYKAATRVLKMAAFPSDCFDVRNERILLEQANYSGYWRVDPEKIDRWKAGKVLKPCADAEL